MHIWLSGLFVAAAMSTAIDAPTFAIDAHIVSAGSSVRSSSDCYQLTATVAEPVAGYASSADYTLNAGFGGTSEAVDDVLFANRFEDCSP